MSVIEALMVTGLGMSVVFIGLALTALMIWSFRVVPEFLQRMRRPAAPPPPAVETVADSAPLDPQVLAVILTVLEIELRLNAPDRGSRLTLTRQRQSVQPPPQRGIFNLT
ncbi:MAG TPA: OadG family protein [Acidobacteriota bacterium]|nr:OadG family protein [Acidobacteriota bacterium]HOT00797.1 OadG family protein [Acidobacteriota bacterium]HQF87046.1 OadG family protein [Acidobacteriota bacterium]HQG91607.1 OadG family protein [Acidobacteriota bacterium]HQK88734.1 OadG family protein [Acidobacteriota bacterium]